MQLYPSSLPRIDKRFNSFLFSLIIIFSVLIATYGLAYTLGLIRSISAEQTCPASLTNGTITGQVIITPDDVDGVVDCSNYDITVGSTGEVIFDRFVTDTDTLAGDWGVTLKVRSLNVQSGGKIHADGKGYLVTEQESPNGEGGSASGTTGGSGGAHGGAGGEGLEDGVNPAPTPGIPYGNQEIPSTLGSAGGNSGDGGQGGAGGGAVKIWATGEVRVDGSITANGQDGTLGVESSGGGGAGGSIWIRALDLAGSGLIEAKGGGSADTAHPGGGGGGGRVIVFCQETNNFSGSANANPGVTNLSQDGGIGSILGPTCLPNAPTTLKQFKSNGTTVIPSGGITTENTIIFASNLSDPDAIETLSLQIEFQPLGTAFTNVPTHTQATGFANPQACSSGTASDCGRITVTDITRSTEYHWQARVRDNRGGISEWVTFGANTEADRDVLVTGAASAITYFSGNNQVATVGTELTDPLVAKVTDAAGFPIPGYTVTWQVINGSGGGLFMDGATTATDSNGLASNRYKVGTIAGTNNNTMRAVAASLSGSPISFTATGAAGELDHFAVIAPQVAIVNQNFDTVTIYARDQYDNPITDYTGTPTLTAVEISPPYNELSGNLSPTTASFSSQDTVTITDMTYDTAESIKIQVTDGEAIGRSNIIAVVISPGTCPDADGIIDTDQTWTADPSNEGIFDCSGLSIEVTNNAVLTLVSYDSGDTNYTNDFGTTIIAANISVDNDAKITAEGQGYLNGRGPGAGTGGYCWATGPSYGGFGDGTSGSANIYGSVYEPTHLGSASGTQYGGTGGGGAIKLNVTNTLTVNGTISSDGGNTAGDCNTGGSGGSIWIDTNMFTGSGAMSISAQGQKGNNKSTGAAGGGRIAIYYSSTDLDINSYISSNRIHALGNTTSSSESNGTRVSGAGTVYIEDKQQHSLRKGDLYINNNNQNGKTAGLTEDAYSFNQVTTVKHGHITVKGQNSSLTLPSGEALVGDSTMPDLTVEGTILYTGTGALEINGVDLGVKGDISGVNDIALGSSQAAGMTLYATTWAHNKDNQYSFGDITVGSNGTLTLVSYDNGDTNWTNDYGVSLNATNLTVDAGGIITANGLGYTEGHGPGAGTGGYCWAQGPSHGGLGDEKTNDAHGNIYEPTDLGSGSGTQYGGTSGGGAVKLDIANTLTVNGTISSDGGTTAGGCNTGGAGGSIWIDTDTLNGSDTGIISTNGKNGNSNNQGAGGGGRIAIYYNTDNWNLSNQILASRVSSQGGSSGGGAGTIYIEDKVNDTQHEARLFVRNNQNSNSAVLLQNSYRFSEINLTNYGHLNLTGTESTLILTPETELSGDTTVSNLTVEGIITYTGEGALEISGVNLGVKGDIVEVSDVIIGTTTKAGMTLYANTWAHNKDNQYSFSNITIGPDGTLTLESYNNGDSDYTNDYGVTVNADNISVEQGGKISADGKGYSRGNGIGFNNDASAYGGYGANNSGTPYGDIYEPDDLGSGGGTINNGGQNGGGAFKLVVSGTLSNNGSIQSNGLNSAGCHSGGATGGSIWIDTNELVGAGTISATGAKGECNGNGGSGGRIAIYYAEDNSSVLSSLMTETPKVTAYGGPGGWGNVYGGPGTVYTQNINDTHGDLRIDNRGTTGYSADFQAAPLNFRNVYIGQNVRVKVSADKDNNQGTILNLSGDFTLESGALIDGVGKGFSSDEGPGTGEAGIGQSGGGGGAHGGSGGDGQSDGGNPNPKGGTFYGHQRVPLTLGSGGGKSGAGALGGNGGGAIAIRARDGHVQINGTINMNGTNGLTSSPGGGGGAGGSILIESSTCEITGDLLANGGNGGNDAFDGGGGGGGRISILYTTGPCDILGTVTTAQGTSESAQTGQEGTYPGTLILPSKPAIRIQQKSDGQTEIPVGETTQEQTVILKASVYDPGATEIAPRTLTAEFEVAPQSESFTSGVLGTSIVASQPITFSGGNPVIAQAEVTDLTPGEGYKWQVRVKNTDAGVSSEWVDFGGNSQDDADFIVSTVEELKLETNKTQVKVGEILSLKVTSLNAQGEVDPSYTGTVRFTSTSNTAVLPASYSFTRESDQGVHEFKGETVFTETGTYTITVTDTVNETLTSTSAEIKVAAAETSMTPEEEQSCSENINQVKCQIEVLITGYSVTTEDSSAKICWSTNIETRGTVEYGIIEDGIAIYSQSTNMTDYGLEHCVDIASLQKKSAYAYQITATSHAGKQATRTGSFATTGGEIPDEFEVLVGIDNVEYSFNSNNQVILRFVTLTDARCSVNYGNDQTNLKFRVESSSTGTLHMVLLELSNLNGSDDLIYIINCSTIGEDEDRTFSKTGIIPVSKYFAYYPIDEKRDGSILDSVKELAKDDVPVILVTLSGITGLVSLLLYPRFILYAIGWLKDRKKSRNWGIVYDKQTREPVAFAVIRLYQKGELIHENISNMEGQFGFPIDKGEYTLVVEHPDYLKQEVNVSSSKTEMINEDVALTDRQRKAIKTTRGLKTNWRRISTFIFYIGFTISLIAVILYPAFYNLLIMLLYLVQITLLNLLKTNRGWGFVYNSGNSTRIQGAFVRLFDAKEGRQVKVQLTDPKGRYGFINEEGEYEIKVDKPGYTFPSTKENKEKLVEMETGEKLLKVDSDKAKTIDVAIAMDPTERSVTGPFGQ